MASESYNLRELCAPYRITGTDIEKAFELAIKTGEAPENMGLSPSEAHSVSGLGKTEFQKFEGPLGYNSTGNGRGRKYNRILLPVFVSKVLQVKQENNI